MSSILDALERASKERSDLLSPPVAEHTAPASVPTRRGLWFMLGVAVVLAALIGYGLLPIPQADDPDPSTQAKDPAPVADETPSSPDVSHSAEPDPVPLSSVAVAPDLQSRLRDTGQPSRQSLLANARVSPARDPLRVEEPEPVKAAENVIEIQPLDAVAPDSVVSDDPSSSSPASAVEPAVKSPAEPLNRETARVPVPMPAEKNPAIPLVWELPQAEREALLELSISIHVYHEDPQRRFVIINMHRYVEGDRLKEKRYRLERIDQDGIVLDYGGGLVRIPRS